MDLAHGNVVVDHDQITSQKTTRQIFSDLTARRTFLSDKVLEHLIKFDNENCRANSTLYSVMFASTEVLPWKVPLKANSSDNTLN
jgi:hypothetical protein